MMTRRLPTETSTVLKMVPKVSRHCCCICGKKRNSNPGVKLHFFPKDAKRRLQWLKTLNIANDKHIQVICENHFEPKYIGSKGRLLSVAVPNPPDGCVKGLSPACDAQSLSLQAEVGADAEVHIDLTDTGKVSDSQMEVPQTDAVNFGIVGGDLSQHSLPQHSQHHHHQAEEQEPQSIVCGGECPASSYVEEGKKIQTSKRKTTRTAQVKLLQNTIYRMKKRMQCMEKYTIKTPEQLISKASQYLEPKICSFFKGQIQHAAVKSRAGRRYGVEERRFALSVYYHSPRTYRFLSTIFHLPSVSTLHCWLRSLSINIGWSKQTLAVLEKQAQTLPKEETLCGIVFDVMTIKESLHFDKDSDSIIGNEDFEEHGKSLKPANRALVFMVKGLVKNWKMVLGCFFYSGRISTSKMREFYETSITKVYNAGFRVFFTVCDQKVVHRSLFQTLGMTTENPSWEINGEKVHFFYDSPLLLKSLRNTLLKYNVNIGENVISWAHIQQFFEKDQNQKIRLAPKLTRKHVCGEGFSKRRVNLAAQVMSRTVAAGIHTYANAGFLPQEAVHTAEFVYQVDRLFDCFNSSCAYHFKDVLAGISLKSCHLKFIRDITPYLKSLSICAPPSVHVHCIDGWLINLASLQALWQGVQSYQVKYLLTRHLTKDCLENLFAKLRVKFRSCDHPSAYKFMKSLKSIVINDLLQVPQSDNCEVVESQFLDLTCNWQLDFLCSPSSDSDSV